MIRQSHKWAQRKASPQVAGIKHLQGPELRHVVETGHGEPADVVVVESAEGRRETEHRKGPRGNHKWDGQRRMAETRRRMILLSAM